MAKNGAKNWPWYVAGPLLAVLTVLSLYLFHDTIGLGDALTMVSEYCVETVETRKVEAPPMDWQFGLLIGIFIGALVAAALSGDLKPKWSDAAGSGAVNWAKSMAGGLSGGFLVMTGIQLSGDTLLGQFAAGMQLSGAAWVFLIVTAVSGILLGSFLSQRGGGKSAPAAKKTADAAKKAGGSPKKAGAK